MELLSTGLLSDANGNMSQRTKAKVLEILGYGSLENTQDITDLHIAKADGENLKFGGGTIEADEFDDHGIHILEHTRFLLSEGAEKNAAAKENAVKHLKEHKAFLRGENAGNASADNAEIAENAVNGQIR